MAHVKLTEYVEAPVEDVFELFTDVERWAEFMPGGSEIKEVTGPLDMVGTRVHEVSTFMGRKMESQVEVVEVERPHLLKLTSEGAGFSGTAAYRMTPVGKGTDVEVEAEYEVPAGFLGQIADRLFIERAVERQMRHAAENFKALLEAKVATPA